MAKSLKVGPFRLTFTKEGRELPDPTPLELPAGTKRPETLQDQIRRLIRTDVSAYAEDHGAESFEDANDFDIDDDEPESRATHHELHEEVVDEFKRARREAKEKEDADSRGADGPEESEGEGESRASRVPAKANRPDSRAGVQRSEKSQARSPERRPTGRREDAQRDDDEIDHGRGKSRQKDIQDD